MQDEKTKVQRVQEFISKNLKPKKLRRVGEVIRFNIETLNDGGVTALGCLSIDEACDINIKRSGTGLVVIIDVQV